MIEPMNVPDDLLGLYADAQLDSAKPWHWMQISPLKIIALIERIARLESENARLSAPVTDAELTPHLLGKKWPITEAFDALIAARKGTA